jgi:carbon-monoxide dehydrogenase small subunit
MSAMVDVSFTLNGHQTRLAVPVHESALTALRGRLDHAGAKLACGEGECGACTIIVDDISVNACLMPAPDLEGRTVRTIEGLWEGGGLSKVQDALIRHGAVQCGFCTPGMVMQATHLIEQQPELSDADVRRGLEGNTCRCTGYSKIVTAVVEASRDAAQETAEAAE